MSCQWIYECVDCRTSFETDRGNHASKEMASILAARPALVEVVAMLEKHGRLLDDVDSFLGGLDVGPLRRLAAWFAAHRAHVVRLVDEYGRVFRTCGVKVGANGYCVLAPEHQGDHDPEAKATSMKAPPQSVTDYLASRPQSGPQCRCPPSYQAGEWRNFPECEIHTEANRVRGLLLALGFKKFRADGWPLCPTCEEDEVYTLATDQAQLRDLLTHAACYRCVRVIVDQGYALRDPTPQALQGDVT